MPFFDKDIIYLYLHVNVKQVYDNECQKQFQYEQNENVYNFSYQSLEERRDNVVEATVLPNNWKRKSYG